MTASEPPTTIRNGEVKGSDDQDGTQLGKSWISFGLLLAILSIVDEQRPRKSREPNSRATVAMKRAKFSFIGCR